MEHLVETDDPQGMTLILKAPRNKPPYIGVQFRDSYTASNCNKEIIEKFRNHKLSIQLELHGTKMRIKIIADNPPRKWVYNDVKVDPQKLSLFLAIKSNVWTFGHTFDYNGKEVVAKTLPENYLFVVKLDYIGVIGDYNL